MADRMPANLILKQQPGPRQPTVSDEQKAKADRDRRNLGIALFHASKIQAQKDAEAAILAVIEKLLDYPAGSVYTVTEASSFRTVIVPFQPSDFDSLIEERRIDIKCGYPLCSNLPRASTLGANASWKLKGKGAADFCSNTCLQKALYVKAQLSEIPAWERQPGQEPEIALPLDDRPASDLAALHVSHHAGQQPLEEWQELALERGENVSSFRPNQVMLDTIVEKRSVSSKQKAFKNPTQAPHDAIEGHVPYQRSGSSVPTSGRLKAGGRGDSSSTPNTQHHVDEEEESWNALYENLSTG